jgi:uncharacterized membrane protein YfcA
MLTSILIACAVLGIVVGFLSGLLGIGGGLVIVPALAYLLPMLNIPANIIMPLALGTSLCSIVITSSSATYAHHKNGNIPWKLTKKFMVAIALGSLLGAFMADILSASVLKNIFAVAVSLLATYMLLSVRVTKTRILPDDIYIFIIAFGCGIIASLMGISGAAILIPILTFFGVTVRNAIGVSTTCGSLVATFGTVGYIISGLDANNLPQWSIGYVYLPALLAIVVTSSIFAPFGVRYANKLPVHTLKRFFALFLLLVALKMIFT